MKQRSHQKELLDGDDIPFEHIKQNMQELETINTLLGGHRITLAGLRHLLNGSKQVHICEVGCGGGDNLKAIMAWCRKKNIAAKYTGIDIKATCINYAKENLADQPVHWICSDYRDVRFDEKPDIIFSSLFCHHFNDDEVAEIFRWKYENARLGFFVNDLHRNIIAQRSIQILTQLFSSSYLVKNDAPLSVERGFRKQDWLTIFNRSGIQGELRWEWAFRWLVTVKK
ncbi:MAG TPA: methyltransferase domain-containing protein [Chitinophagaceae bacterium]|nr:methyltransferase domain-containing protein [Chitinophagaceae bacterium]